MVKSHGLNVNHSFCIFECLKGDSGFPHTFVQFNHYSEQILFTVFMRDFSIFQCLDVSNVVNRHRCQHKSRKPQWQMSIGEKVVLSQRYLDVIASERLTTTMFNVWIYFFIWGRSGCIAGAVAEWVRASDWRPGGHGFESCCHYFASELWQFRLPPFASVSPRRH